MPNTKRDETSDMQIVISVTPKSCNLHIYYGSDNFTGDNVSVHSFVDMRHLLGTFGDMLPLTNCEIHIKGFTY